MAMKKPWENDDSAVDHIILLKQPGSSAGARRFPRQGSQRLAGWGLRGDLEKQVGMGECTL